MFGFDVQQIVAIALIAVGGIGFVAMNWGKVAGFLGRIWPAGGKTATVPTVELDQNTLDFQALDRVQKRFARLKCKEGLDACSVQLQHFYHGEGEH